MATRKRKPPRRAGKKPAQEMTLTDYARQSMEAVDPDLFLWCQGGLLRRGQPQYAGAEPGI